MRPIWLCLALFPVLAACASRPDAAQYRKTHPGIGGAAVSAPLNTPLCGTALREQAQNGAALYPQSMSPTLGECPRNACFQPLTGTFIAADGAPSVCR